MLYIKDNIRSGSKHIFDGDPITDIRNIEPKQKIILAPIDFDTEYVDLIERLLKSGIIKKILDGDLLPTINLNTEYRKLVSLQAKPVKTHKDLALVCSITNRYHEIPKETILIELLNKFTKNKWSLVNKPVGRKDKNRAIRFMQYSHFAMVDTPYLATGGSFKKELHSMFSSKKYFNMTKRLRAGDKYRSYTKFRQHLICCEDTDELFAIELEIIDTIGLFGNKSLKESLIISGLGDRINDKDIGKDLNLAYELGYLPIENMDLFALDRPELNHKYITGDLCLYDMIVANFDQYKVIHEDLGLPSNWLREPKLTIGATVARLLEQVLCRRYGIDWLSNKAELHQLLAGANPKLLLEKNNTNSLLAKVFGGLCLNNRPLDRKTVGVLADMDQDGSYGTGMMQLPLCLGSPETPNFPIDDRNDYPTLRKWLKAYQDELIPNAWIANIDSRGYTLKYKQDYFQSWLVPSNKIKHSVKDKWYAECLKLELEKLENNTKEVATDKSSLIDFLDKGNVKILQEEIRAGILTHEGLDLILNIASEKQRKELLDNLIVTGWIVYPASTRCKNYENYKEKVEAWKGSRTFERKKLKGKFNIRWMRDGNHTYWFADTLGDLLIQHIIINRKRYPKKPRHPLNDYYKLLCNTIYGVLCSPYFKVSNTVAGNNITSRCRHESWMFMKSCYSNIIVTDGGVFDLNNVVYPRNNRTRVNSENTVNWIGLKNKNLKLAPIDNCDHIEISDDGLLVIYKDNEKIKLNKKEAEDWINNAVCDHIAKTFPNSWAVNSDRVSFKVKADYNTNELIAVERIPCKGYFDWEVKGFFDVAVIHSASNYRLINSKNGIDIMKMRGYQFKDHYNSEVFKDGFIKYDDGSIERITNKTNPAKELLDCLTSDIDKVKIPKIGVITLLLKLDQYQDNPYKYDSMGMTIGDSLVKVVKLLPFSKGHLLYNTAEQFYNWDKAILSNKNKNGLGLESCFIDDDGSINYDNMIASAYEAVNSGINNPFTYLKKGDRLKKWIGIENPDLTYYNKIKDYFKPIENEIDW